MLVDQAATQSKVKRALSPGVPHKSPLSPSLLELEIVCLKLTWPISVLVSTQCSHRHLHSRCKRTSTCYRNSQARKTTMDRRLDPQGTSMLYHTHKHAFPPNGTHADTPTKLGHGQVSVVCSVSRDSAGNLRDHRGKTTELCSLIGGGAFLLDASISQPLAQVSTHHLAQIRPPGRHRDRTT